MVDSGACTAVLKPHSFPNTDIKQTILSGQAYRACGGNEVRNLGEKRVAVLDSEGHIMSDIDVQVTDKVTRLLLAVSKLCEMCRGSMSCF